MKEGWKGSANFRDLYASRLVSVAADCKSWYRDDAETFNPKRFIGNETSLLHLTFGAGSRICPAAALSNRII